MVTKLIVHYEIAENLRKELDKKMREINRERKKRTLDLEEIKRATEELEEAGEKYEKAERNWLLEKKLVRTKLKLELIRPEGARPLEGLTVALRKARLRAELAEERWEFKQRKKIPKWEKRLKQASSAYELFLVIEQAPEQVKEKAWEKFLEQNPDKHDLDMVITFGPERYKTKAQEVLNKVLKKEIYV